MIEKYKSLSDQAEEIDSHESYKELIEIIRELNYKDLFNIMRDTETALMVIARGESKGAEPGIGVMIKDILELGNYCMEKHFGFLLPKEEDKEPYLRYTYEFIEQRDSCG